MVCDRAGLFFQGEVPRIEEVDFRVRNISFECFRTGGLILRKISCHWG